MNSRAHQLKVADVIKETAEAVSLIFDVPDDLIGRFGYSPGQFLTLAIPRGRTGSVARCYSLSSSPHCDDRIAVTVKRTVEGYASNWLCDNIAPGSIVSVLEPSGTFVPRSLDRDVLLCAGGSGITPVMSITKSILAAGTGKVAVLYGNRDQDSVIFARELHQLESEYSDRLTVLHWLVSERGLPNSVEITRLVRPYVGREVYLCGPTGFAAATLAALSVLGIPEQQVHQEQYRSLDVNPFEDRVTSSPEVSTDIPRAGNGNPVVEVEIDGETHIFEWPKHKKLLDVLLDKGIDAPYVCRESACGTCVCSVKKGRIRMLLNESLIEEELERGLTLACQTLPESDHVHIAFDQ